MPRRVAFLAPPLTLLSRPVRTGLVACLLAGAVALGASPRISRGQDQPQAQPQQAQPQPGREDLDAATTLQLTANTPRDLQKVAQLCESALKKGLSADDQQFAKMLLASSSLQYAEVMSRQALSTPPSPRWQVLRQVAMQSLERAVEADPKLADAHELIVKLQALPDGDLGRARKAADALIEIYADDKTQLAQALVLRVPLLEDEKQQLGDLKRAVDLAPQLPEIWQDLAAFYISRDRFEEAVDAFKKLTELAPDNVNAKLALAETLSQLKRQEEADQVIEQALKDHPDAAAAFVARAQMQIREDHNEQALKDLGRALELEPDNLATRLFRAELLLAEEQLDEAEKDIDLVLKGRPGLIAGLLLHSRLFAARKDYGAAIRELELVIDNTQEPPSSWRLLLAAFYSQDERPRKAIQIISDVIEDEPENADALRSRGDAYLSVGKHTDAIADFERALKIEPEDSGLLNNLAWVLATSPDDAIRDAKRSIELGTKACELTEYKEAHILSTLASGYAESGDFETAIRWSTKAVELGEGEMKEQLRKELESYQQKMPWREKQDVKEKGDPANVLET